MLQVSIHPGRAAAMTDKLARSLNGAAEIVRVKIAILGRDPSADQRLQRAGFQQTV